MEMPEALKRIFTNVQRTRLGRIEISDIDADSWLKLTIEMVNALELCTEFYPELDHLSKMEEMRKLNASLVLKKFKEWK